jgi:hypothetical protein
VPTYRGAYGAEPQTVPGTLRGYRAWRVDRDWRFLGLHNTRLQSVNSDNPHAWGSKEPQQAACRPFRTCFCELRGCRDCIAAKDHRSPAEKCSCGYYATYDPDSYKVYARVGRIYIHGCVKAFGLISLGTQGFRAEYAQVEAVYGLGARAAARYYGVPWFRSQKRMLEHFPPQDVTELLV